MNLLDLKEKVTASSLQAPNGNNGEIVPLCLWCHTNCSPGCSGSECSNGCASSQCTKCSNGCNSVCSHGCTLCTVGLSIY